MVFYCFANVFLVLAWQNILKHFGVRTSMRWAFQTYGISQIGKYIPGNIFHFAGRQAIGQAANIPASPLAKSAVWEIGLLAVTGVFFSVLIIPLFWSYLTFQLTLIIFIILLLISISGVSIWLGTSVASAIKWDVVFLTTSGIVFYGVLLLSTTVKPEIAPLYIGIIGVYVIAWLAGLLTPGAPAGIGVREMVFVTLLHAVINEGELLKAIILGRFVTVGGDVLFYIFSLILRFGQKNRPDGH